MRYGRYGLSHLFLSFGLGIVFAWIGIDILRHPNAWIGYLPQTIPFGLSRELALKINGGIDLALGLSFMARNWPKITSLVATGHLLAILITQGLDAVLIRDIGLLGASLALFFWPHRRRHGFSFFRKKPSYQHIES